MILIVEHQKSIKNVVMEAACSVSFRFASGQHPSQELHSISIIEPIQTRLHPPDLESQDRSTNVGQVLLDAEK